MRRQRERHCKRCGQPCWPNRFVCDACLSKWYHRHDDAYPQVEKELGPLTSENHAEFVARLKELEAMK